jgi:hypothetical protein
VLELGAQRSVVRELDVEVHLAPLYSRELAL